MLCQPCLGCLQSDQSGLYKGETTTLDDLVSASNAGCYTCSNVLRGLQDEDVVERLREQAAAPLFHRSMMDDKSIFSLSFCFYLCSPLAKNPILRTWYYKLVPVSEEKSHHGFDFENYTSASPRLIHRFYQNVPSTTRSPQVGALARKWLDTCRTDHQACHQVLSVLERAVPPRLLDLASDSPRLVDGSILSPNDPYAALSHCWGHETFLTLTQERLHEFQDAGIDPSALPANFKDAIEICGWLNIRYLWIDSLCILQSGLGSQEDWEQHTKLMMDIYTGCEVCISTAATTSATKPCLGERKSEHVSPVSILRSSSAYILVSMDHQLQGFREMPIASRAWCLQERLFSPRILSIGREQIFWECNTTYEDNVCETFPSGIRAIFFSRGPFSMPPVPQALPTTGVDTNFPDRSIWLLLLRIYSECFMTYSEDKFAAFAGIAAHMQRVFRNSLYLAGFFEFELPQSLIWSVKPNTRPVHQSGQCRAPTWSWAATDASIQFPNLYTLAIASKSPQKIILLAMLLAHCIKLKNPENEFNNFTHAELKLRAPLIPLSWEDTNHLGKDFSSGDPEKSSTIYKLFHFYLDDSAATFYFDSLEVLQSGHENVFFAPILRTEKFTPPPFGGTNLAEYPPLIQGLILRTTREYEKSEIDPDIDRAMYFERIGSAEIKLSDLLDRLERLEKKDFILF